MDREDYVEQTVFPVLDRLVEAGLATGWRSTPRSMHVDWNPDFEDGLGGQVAFQGFVHLLRLLQPREPLSATDQQVMLMLDMILKVPPAEELEE